METTLTAGNQPGRDGTEEGRSPTEVPSLPGGPAAPAGDGCPQALNPEVPEKPHRRSFSRPYRLQIVQQADACSKHGELGQLLRREGLYSSHLAAWRQQRDAGLLTAAATRRGRKKLVANPLTAENEQLRRENQQLTARLQQAETILDVQKKVCTLLGLIPNATPSTENDS